MLINCFKFIISLLLAIQLLVQPIVAVSNLKTYNNGRALIVKDSKYETILGVGGLRSSARELNEILKVSDEVLEYQRVLSKSQDILNAKNNPEGEQKKAGEIWDKSRLQQFRRMPKERNLFTFRAFIYIFFWLKSRLISDFIL